MKHQVNILKFANLLTYLYTAILYVFLFTSKSINLEHEAVDLTYLSLFSLIAITTYSSRVFVNKKTKGYFSLSLIVFLIASILITQHIVQNNITFFTLSLVYFQNLMYRLMYRTIYGGFPVFSFLLNLMIMMFSSTKSTITLIPIAYKIINSIEDTKSYQSSYIYRTVEKYVSIQSFNILYIAVIIFKILERYN